MNKHQELAVRALENLRGDNLYRAKMAFRNITPAEMQQPYGMSGQTRAQIIAGYEDHVAKVDAAIEWVKGQR